MVGHGDSVGFGKVEVEGGGGGRGRGKETRGWGRLSGEGG